MIERLPKEFKGRGEVNNYFYTQVYVKKCNDGKYAYIYEQTEKFGKNDYYIAGYEVVKPKIDYKFTFDIIDGKRTPVKNDVLKEYYPNSECFGTNAFSCKTLQIAMQKIADF